MRCEREKERGLQSKVLESQLLLMTVLSLFGSTQSEIVDTVEERMFETFFRCPTFRAIESAERERQQTA